MDYARQATLGSWIDPSEKTSLATQQVSTLERYRRQRDEMTRRLDDLNQLIVLLEGDEKIQQILTLMGRV